jgi:hypothetical protein
MSLKVLGADKLGRPWPSCERAQYLAARIAASPSWS